MCIPRLIPCPPGGPSAGRLLEFLLFPYTKSEFGLRDPLGSVASGWGGCLQLRSFRANDFGTSRKATATLA